MNKTNRIISAVALLLLPIAMRLAWTSVFPFTYQPSVTTPNFEQATIPEPPTASAPLAGIESGLASGQVVLIDYAHENQFYVNEIEPFTRALTSRGAITEIYMGQESLEHHLKYASAYVIISPLGLFSPQEIRSIERFVADGGRLLVFTDPTRGIAFFEFSFPDIDSANLLLSSTGIAFSGDYLYNLTENEGNFRNVKFSDFGEHPLTEDLGMVVLYGAHSVSAGNGTALLKASDKTVSSLTDQGGDLAGMALSADGSVLASGDFTFMTTPFFTVADNALLVERVAEFALGSQRQPSLANFPYLFKGDVTLVPLGTTRLTSELLYSISALQSVFRLGNINLSIGAEPGQANNLLIGTYEEDEVILALLEKYEIEIDDSREFVIIPGIGKIGLMGTGAMLLEPGPNGNTLILLADTSENLDALLVMFSQGDLFGCVIQGNMGVCSLGSGGSFDDGGYDDYYYDDDGYYEEDYIEEEPTPEATPSG
jgi:hypothetical protein